MAKKQPNQKPAIQNLQPHDEFDDLPEQTKSLDIAGWFSPQDDKPLPQVVKGYVLDCVARKAPRKNQSATFLVFKLAAPVIGLRFNGDDSEEDTLETGEIIGIDMRQALQPLSEHRGAVKITFIEKQEVKDRQWWRTKVQFDPKAPVSEEAVRHSTRKVNSDGSDRTPVQDDDIPF